MTVAHRSSLPQVTQAVRIPTQDETNVMNDVYEVRSGHVTLTSMANTPEKHCHLQHDLPGTTSLNFIAINQTFMALPLFYMLVRSQNTRDPPSMPLLFATISCRPSEVPVSADMPQSCPLKVARNSQCLPISIALYVDVIELSCT